MNRLMLFRLAAVSCAIALVAIAGCSGPRAEGAAPGHPPDADLASHDVPGVAVARVARGDVVQVLKVTAAFRPFQEIDVHAKVAGFVKTIAVDVGDRVQAGQLIAVLEIPELQDEMQQDDASVLRSQDEINRAEADLQRAESAHEVAHLGAARLSSISKARPNLVAQQDIDEATGRDQVSEAQVSTARAALASAQEQLAVAKASQNKTRTLFAYARITAPFAGVITHRYADTGAMIQAGTASQTQSMPVVRLSQNARLRLVIPVPESAVSRIRVGTEVQLAVQSLHRTFTGTVARFANRLDADTRTMLVEVDVMNPDLELVPGMYADASVVLDQARDAIVAPIEAIDRAGRAPQVLLVNETGRVEVRPVALGLEAGDRVQVTSGLSVGELVVVGNRSQLKAGVEVKPKLAAAAAEASH